MVLDREGLDGRGFALLIQPACHLRAAHHFCASEDTRKPACTLTNRSSVGFAEPQAGFWSATSRFFPEDRVAPRALPEQVGRLFAR